MSMPGDIIISLNSCLQDIAVAFLAVGLTVVQILSIKYPASGEAAGADLFLRVYKIVARINSYAFSMMIVTGALMAVYIRRGGGPLRPGYPQVVVVSVKCGTMLILAVIGLFIWSGLSKKVGRLGSKPNF